MSINASIAGVMRSLPIQDVASALRPKMLSN